MKRRYELLIGSHADEHGKNYKKGDIVVSHRPLDTLFVPKFKDLGPLEETTSKEVSGLSLDEIDPSLGRDVTALFTGTDQVGVKVLKLGTVYSIVIPKDGTVVQTGITKKAQVQAFIDERL